MKEATNLVKLRNIVVTSYATITLNLFCIVLGILYNLNPTSSILWDIFGVILTLTLFENLLYIYFNLHKRNILRGKTRMISYVFLIVIIFAIPCMMMGNLLLSVTYSNKIIDTLGAYVLTYFGYFSVLIYGLSFALFNIIKLTNIDVLLLNHTFNMPDKRKYLRTKRITRKILVVFSRITFILGIVFAVVIIFGSFEVVTTFIAIISGQFGIFFSIIFLANTILLLKLKARRRTTKKFYRTAILGFFVSGCLLMPVLMTNFTVFNARRSFASAFGNDWKDRIPSSANQHFLRTLSICEIH